MESTTGSNEQIREKCGAAARRAAAGAKGVGCCSATRGGRGEGIPTNLCTGEDRDSVPDTAVAASLGCGNPTAFVELKAGQTVLDLGSGGGVDVLLSARRVGPTGKVYGLDMTDD